MIGRCGLTREQIAALEAMSKPDIPLPKCTSTMLLNDLFWDAWLKFLWRYKRRSPLLMRFIAFGPNDAKDESTSKLARKVDIANSWIGEAKADFQKSPVSFFWRCQVADHAVRSKHWRAAHADKKMIWEQSRKNDEGIFLPELRRTMLQEGLWCLFALFWDDFRRKRIRFACVNFEIPVGYAYGEITSWVCYDIDYSALQSHAYPVSEKEALKRRRLELSFLELKASLKGRSLKTLA